MKNKKMTYFLVPVVIIIWGLVIYKIFSYTDSSSDKNAIPTISNQKETIAIEKDTFSIIADYKDPFLGKNISIYDEDYNNETESENDKKKVPEVKKEEPKINIKWPSIIYGGIIYNAKTKKSVGLVKINNRDYLGNKGNKIEEIEIVEMYNDSIKVKFSEQLKTIIKN